MPILKKHNPGESLTDPERALVACIQSIITALRGADIELGNAERTNPLPLAWNGLIHTLAEQTGVEPPYATYAMLQADYRTEFLGWLNACCLFMDDVTGEKVQREVRVS